jgi:hypothetical protein
MCMDLHTHTHTHMYIYILQFTYTHIYRHICMYTNIHVYLHTGFRANSALVWTIGQPSFARHLSQNGGHTRCPHGAKAIAVGPNTSKHTGHGRSPALSSCLCNAGFETAWNGELPSCTACESGTYKAAPGSESACTLCEGALSSYYQQVLPFFASQTLHKIIFFKKKFRRCK